MTSGLPSVGDRIAIRRVGPIDAAHVEAFARVSGDRNPIHLDAGAARRVGLAAPPVHGMQLVALMHEAAAAGGAEVMAFSTRFLAPVAVGETVEVSGRIVKVEPGGPQGCAIMRLFLRTSDGTLACDRRSPPGHPRHRTGPAVTQGPILITGATSGIGRALALAYAGPGTTLLLLGRHSGRMEAVRRDCEAKGARVATALVDSRDGAAMASCLVGWDRDHPIGLAIAGAGITSGLGPGRDVETPQARQAVLATNLMGVLNTLDPLLGPDDGQAPRPPRRHRLARRAAGPAVLAGLFGGQGRHPCLCRRHATRIWHATASP